MPLAVFVLGFGIFSMTSSEFMMSGLMPQVAEGLGVSIVEVGYLISTFAIGMVIGGRYGRSSAGYQAELAIAAIILWLRGTTGRALEVTGGAMTGTRAA